MDKPILIKEHSALEYIFLFKDKNNMSYYSAKMEDDKYLVVDDYDCDDDLWSEEQIILIEKDRLLCKRENKYGVVDLEGWCIIPFIYDKFEKRKEIDISLYNVLLDFRWGVIDSSGKEVIRIKYSYPIPLLKYPKVLTKEYLFCNKSIIMENADSHRLGLIDFEGKEIVPTIYSRIERCKNYNYVYVNLGAIENPDVECSFNGLWGCYNWKGKVIVPVKYHSIHYNKDYFIAGDDEYNESNKYIGTYDLYDLEGNMIIGGFNNIQIGSDYFILDYGIVVNNYLKAIYYEDIECGEKLVQDIDINKKCSIIISKDLVSYIPRHLIDDTREEIEFEYDFLCNNLPKDKGLLIEEHPRLSKGKIYSAKDRLIKGISICSAFYISDNIVMYCSDKEVELPNNSIEKLKGLIFCDKSIVIAPQYINAKSINKELLFIMNKDNHVGIRNIDKELLKQEFDLITIPYNNIAIGFKISYVEEKESYECDCFLLRFYNDSITQENIVKITGSQLYVLLYSDEEFYMTSYVPEKPYSDWSQYNICDETKVLINNYWKHIFSKTYCFWYPTHINFRYIKDFQHNQDLHNYNSDDLSSLYDWGYYNDNVDIDQQDENFWNF